MIYALAVREGSLMHFNFNLRSLLAVGPELWDNLLIRANDAVIGTFTALEFERNMKASKDDSAVFDEVGGSE